jgi:hypothetical protein
MLGDRMYYAMKEGRLTRTQIRRLFYDNWEADGHPFAVYMQLKKKVAGVKIPKRM